MQGSTGGAFNVFWQPPNRTDHVTITEALQATLHPRTPSELRRQALEYLENLKHAHDCPHVGYTFADDRTQPDAVRYFGLQLLEHAARLRWNAYNAEQHAQIREWVKALAAGLVERDAGFIRNKTAQVWVEVAKRCWGTDEEGDGEWGDMDAGLVRLWNKSVSEYGWAARLFVLYVLEILSEDVMQGEDTAAGLRGDVLGQCLNEVLVPPGLYAELQATRGRRQEVRSEYQGWLDRTFDFLADCTRQVKAGGDPEMVRAATGCALKALHAMRPTMAWIDPKAAVEVHAVDCLYLAFNTKDLVLQTAATEVLYALLSRPYASANNESSASLYWDALRGDRMQLIRGAFERSETSPRKDEEDEEDEEKYTLQKKMSDLLSVLGDVVAQNAAKLLQMPLGSEPAWPAVFELLLFVLQSQSLVVSIPVLHSWTKLVAVQDKTVVDLVVRFLGPLLQICSERLLRYEALGEDSDDEIVQYLFDDFDTMPERHSFLGNYRRYCVLVIQTISRTRPLDALQHVLGQMGQLLDGGPYTFSRGLDPASYSKKGLQILQFDAQFQVVTSALKGHQMWLTDVSSYAPEDELHTKAEKNRMASAQMLEEWCSGMINTDVDDPEVAAQLLQTLVAVLRTVRPGTALILQVVHHLLTVQLEDHPAYPTFSDAVKAFEVLRMSELQKLALTFSDELLGVYDGLEVEVAALASKHNDDLRLTWGYRAFLFTIIHRASGIDRKGRRARLGQMLEPVYEAWQDAVFLSSLASLPSFSQSLGLGTSELPEFYRAYDFAETQDWSSRGLDEAGQARQAVIKNKNDTTPLRSTKSMLAASTEKLKTDGEDYEVASKLWSQMVPVILPNLLKMVRHAQAFHNMENWSHLPDELQIVVKRTLQDRFWQSGISNESKDEFYARISGSKTSYEGFASNVRGTVRNIREQGYGVIYMLTKFESAFYDLPHLAEPLAEALFADADALPANHLHPLINLTTGLVGRCPPRRREEFLPPLLMRFFTKLDQKISAEWDFIERAGEQNKEDDELSDEMRGESVLRQLTYAMVSFVPFLLDFDSQQQPSSSHANGHPIPSRPTLSDIFLSHPSVLEPGILFCTHALRMRDTRCCTTITRVFRSIIPRFTSPTEAPAPQVREFISTEVLKACILSLHEPYFADLQKDLASLVAMILSLYAPLTRTVRSVLCDVQGVEGAKVDKVLSRLASNAEARMSERAQRSLVLDLLEGVRGRSIHEAGRIGLGAGSGEKKKAARKGGAGQKRWMEVEPAPRVEPGQENGLENVADLFG